MPIQLFVSNSLSQLAKQLSEDLPLSKSGVFGQQQIVTQTEGMNNWLTIQIANALMTHLEPKAVGVVIRCRHMCMESRGISTAGEETVTSAMLGELQPNLALRTEFLALTREA